jgi:hypothetical protein
MLTMDEIDKLITERRLVATIDLIRTAAEAEANRIALLVIDPLTSLMPRLEE